MIFSDGECPSCEYTQLHLNTLDLLECPQCHLVCAYRGDGIATILPQRGSGDFRFEDCRIVPFNGVVFAKSISGGLAPAIGTIFSSRTDITAYIDSLPKEGTTSTQGEKLSGDFLAAFRETILECSPEVLRLAWASRRARTEFYTQYAMPAIAGRLDLEQGCEEFKIDYVMSKVVRSGHRVPEIFIESENDYAKAEHEIRKLCSVNSPLRYLLTITNKPLHSSPESGAYKQLREWQAIVRSHYEGNPEFRGIIGIIISRYSEECLEFFECAFRSSGDLLRPLSRLLLYKLDDFKRK